MKNNNIFTAEHYITHGGTMHSDDVAAAALLSIINPKADVKRVFSMPENPDAVAFDIGGGKYDHHQPDAIINPDINIKYSAFGLIIKDGFETGYLSEQQYKTLKILADVIDITDNTGKEKLPFMHDITAMNPTWLDNLPENIPEGKTAKDVSDERFFAAVEVFKGVIEKCMDPHTKVENPIELANDTFANSEPVKEARVSAERANEMAIEICETAVRSPETFKNGVLNLPYPNVNVNDWLLNTKEEVYFVVSPSPRGGFSCKTVQPVEKDGTRHEAVLKFPQEWCVGVFSDNPPVPGLNFCHTGNFMASFDTLEHARAALESLVMMYKDEKYFDGNEEDKNKTVPKGHGDGYKNRPAPEGHGDGGTR